jgi:hypothetical protein
MAGMLGRRPTDKTRPVLRLGAHLTASAFQAPSQIDYASLVDQWVLGGNDRFGTCGPTSVANFALLVSSALADAPVRFTDEEVFDLYRRSGNPNFDPATGADDNGVDMTVMLAALVKGGIGFGDRNVKALAFGTLNAYDPTETWAAGALFGGVLWGADLDVSQSRQFDAGQPWDYAPTSAWGGHAILAAHRYSDVEGTLADRTALVTWAELIDATDTFIAQQVPEVYAVIWPWHLKDRGFLQGIDLTGVAVEYERLTGRQFPEIPAPQPAPSEDQITFTPEQYAAIADWAAQPHWWARATRAAAAWKSAVQ